MSLNHKLKSLCLVTLSGIGGYTVISIYKNEPKFYKNVVMPVIHKIDAEQAHKLGVFTCKYRLFPRSNYEDPALLKVCVFGLTLENPIGIAAGFDKNGEAVLGLKDLGFGFVEVGSVTPEPQPGNEKPRVFRLPQDLAVINRYGFNSDGHDSVYERLKKLKSTRKNVIVGVNLGKNKISHDAINDYVRGIEKFGLLADYFVINISSPNTPGLRTMQHKSTLETLLDGAIKARNNLNVVKKPPLLLKLAPDLSPNELKDIADVVTKTQFKVDGLIIGNTTIARPQFLKCGDVKNETGGLSGLPLRNQSTQIIREMYKLTKGEIPIVGVGGVFTGRDAYDKIKAGACLVQIYTSLIYEGPPVVTKIKMELHELLVADGYSSISDAIGSGTK